MTTQSSEPASLAPPLGPAGPRRHQRGVRIPQLLMSLLVVAVFALLAVWWQANASERVPALALANDVEVGVPLERGDLTEIYINTDVPSRFEAPEFVDLFVGVTPVTDLEAGTIITGAMFRRSSPLGAGEALVGLRLGGDETPSSLTPGDRVQVIGRGASGEVVVLAFDARVESVGPTGTDGGLAVRLRLGIEQAQRVQLDASELVLIEVDNSGPASWQADETSGS